MTKQARDIPRSKEVAPDQPLQTGAANGSTAAFRSILFPPGFEALRTEHGDQPACFVDLNLDQIIAAVVVKRDEDVLRPIFYSPYRNEEIVRYRQAVFCDLERSDIFAIFPAFCGAMRTVRANLGYAEKIPYKNHRYTVILRAAWLYCEP